MVSNYKIVNFEYIRKAKIGYLVCLSEDIPQKIRESESDGTLKLRKNISVDN